MRGSLSLCLLCGVLSVGREVVCSCRFERLVEDGILSSYVFTYSVTGTGVLQMADYYIKVSR